MEDKTAALQQKSMEMQQKTDHTRACLTMKYSAAAREYAKQRHSSNMRSCGTGASKEIKLAHQYANECFTTV